MVPLWQLAQVPGVTPVWLNVAGVQPVVRWQLSQRCGRRHVVGRLAAWRVVPLWQLAQVPGVTPVWLNVAGVQPVVR